nr:phage/plasmid primase, P4 family [Aquisalimonas asiatica]
MNEPFNPKRAHVTAVLDALDAQVGIPDAQYVPCWWPSVCESGLDPSDLLILQNGILDMESEEFRPHTPELFAPSALPYRYEPEAQCPEWLRFLDTLWPEDQSSIDALQEWFGYLLTNDTRYQTIFLLIGPPAAGKGVITRVLTELVGATNVAQPTLTTLASPYGLGPLIQEGVTRKLAIITDARVGQRAQIAVERLLQISGEDRVTIERKNSNRSWHGKLPTRFLIVSNHPPALPDTSGALLRRYVPLELTRTFSAERDPSLDKRLLTELPGILNWSLTGLRRLRQREKFEQSAGGESLLGHLSHSTSLVRAFVGEKCTIAPHRYTSRVGLYREWRKWCEHRGERPGSHSAFGRELRAAFPGQIDDGREGSGERAYRYNGIGVDGPYFFEL